MNQRLTTAQVGQILAALNRGVKQSEIAARFAISQSHVSRLKNRKRRDLTIRKINQKHCRIMPLNSALLKVSAN